ncbi:MAG: glycosyltransferase [Acidimicrobiales bacterium]|nr:glycosyltransferase [Acidimicrobiales bacterium]
MAKVAILSMHTSPLDQPGIGDSGGMNVYVRELSSALARMNNDCFIFTRSEDYFEVIQREPGVTVFKVPAGPIGAIPKEQLIDVIPEFTKNVYEILHDLMDEGLQIDAIHANYWLSGVSGHELKHKLDVPLISTFHTLDRVKAEVVTDSSLEIDIYNRAEAESAIVKCSDILLASCEVESDQLVELYSAEKSRIVVAPLGVDLAYFSPGYRPQARRSLGLDESKPLLLFAGRIQPLKGLDVALQAFAILRESMPDVGLLVVGGPSGAEGGYELKMFQSRVKELGLGGFVHYMPPVPHEILSTIYRAADVCLVPSRSESFGLVALEASACGTPVVASDVGGLSTLVLDGNTGFLVTPADPSGFAKMAEVILRDPGIKNELSIN